jgi:hypothetical protein
MSVHDEYLPVCRYCGGDLIMSFRADRWAVEGDGGKPCPESVAAGYPAHCPTPKWSKKKKKERA